MRIAFASVVVVAGLIAFAAAPGRSDDNAGKTAVAERTPVATSASLRRLVGEKVEIPEQFRAGTVPLKIVLGHLVDIAAQRRESLPITIDKQAFRNLAPDGVEQLADFPIEFPAFARMLSIRQILDSSLSQLPGEASFVIREGVLDIAPRYALRSERLLDQTVAVDFRNKSLIAAIEELSDRSGLSIAVDPRCDEGNKKTITLQTEQGMTVRGVLDSIADMNDLKVLVTAHRVTVLPEAIYLRRLSDQLKEGKLRGEIGNDSAITEGPRLDPAPNRAQ